MAELFKLVVTVPEKDADMLRSVIGDAGGGKVGNYSHCSFSSKGIGRFLPGDGANPAIGNVGKPEQVIEERIEITCNKDVLTEVAETIRKHHPYEEPAIDVYRLESL